MVTGSGSAPILARAPVEDGVLHRAHAWRKWALTLDNGDAIAFMVWLDNVFSFGPSANNAARIIEDVALYMMEHWSLNISKSSKEVLV